MLRHADLGELPVVVGVVFSGLLLIVGQRHRSVRKAVNGDVVNR